MKQVSKKDTQPKNIIIAIITGVVMFAFSLAIMNQLIDGNSNKNKEATTSSSEDKFQELKNIIGTDGTILIANSTEPSEASTASQAPFKVVVNYPNSLDCSTAKLASYNTFKNIYQTSNLTSIIDQVVITYPNAVATSLLVEDSKNEGWWTGQTNFYNYITSNYLVETSPQSRSTFVHLLSNCQ